MTKTKDLSRSIAYFSMEIGFHADVPTYSGGLGMLAGDTIRSAADMHVPMVAVTLIHRKGYFFQKLDANAWQVEESAHWIVDDYLIDTQTQTSLIIEGRNVLLHAWLYEVTGIDGFVIPIYLLDSKLSENSEYDRTLTDFLYGGDEQYRLCQEIILGIGGVRMLRSLGYEDIVRYHMNEGHSALLTTELLRENSVSDSLENIDRKTVDLVRRQCVFTTHTPVPAGHDRFELDMVERLFGGRKECGIHDSICHQDRLNMTYLALYLSHYVNGVAKRHGDISRHMFAEYKIDSITNGVHAGTWVSGSFAKLFDQFIPGWREDNFSLRYAQAIPNEDIWSAHAQSKHELIGYINRTTNAGFDRDHLTFGFGRRAAAYKRGDLILQDLDRLKGIARDVGKFQLVFGGKAHPHDNEGKEMIQHIIQIAGALYPEIPIVYLPNYDMNLARLMTAGVDVWLNTPKPPLEASGTSGMKAALNGIPSLSILDGWWMEGCLEGLTGWGIEDNGDNGATALTLYEKLENVVTLYYRSRDEFVNVMKHTIAINGSFFNTHRMMQQYITKAYFP